MGLGSLFGGLALGAALFGHSSSQKESFIDQAYRSAQQNGMANLCQAIASSHYCNEVSKNSYKEKVNYFDAYRHLDVYLARLVGEGSGGIGLLILTCRYLRVDIPKLNNIIPALKKARDYRNMLAHNKNRWVNIPNPDESSKKALIQLSYIVEDYSNYLAKMMYKEKLYQNQKRKRH